MSATRSPATGGVIGTGTGATARGAITSADGSTVAAGACGDDGGAGVPAAGVTSGAATELGPTGGAAGRNPEPPVLTSSAVRAVLAVRTERAPSAVVTDGRLVSLDEASSEALLRAVSVAAALLLRAAL